LDGLDSTQFTLTSSFAAQTASFTAFTASILSYTASQLVLNGTYATTGSNTFAGIQTINSNLVVTGSITAQTLVVQTITSSVDFVTGSTRFGSILANTHVFTGSVSTTGSITVSGRVYGTTTGLNSDFDSGGIISYSSGSTLKYIQMGYDQSGNYGWIQALEQGTAYKNLTLNAAGGNVGIGTTSPFAIASTNLSVNGASSAIQLGVAGVRNAQFYADGAEVRLYAVTNVPLRFGTNDTEVMRITGSLVGIGTTSPSQKLHIASSSNPYIRIDDTGVNSEGGVIMQPTGYNAKGGLTLNFSNGEFKMFTGETGNGYFQTFYTNGVERLRLATSGKVTIPSGAYGTSYYTMNYTSANAGSREWAIGSDTAGWGSFSIGQATTQGGSTFSDKIVITSDGTMLVGGASSSGAYNLSLGNATANTYYQVRSTNTNALYGADTRGTWIGNLSSKETYSNGGHFVPGVDNTVYCGSSSYRWAAVYAANGAIQTSDQRLKTNIQTSDLGLNFITQLNPVSYKWIVGGNTVEYSSTEDENGKLTPTSVATPFAGRRTHYGLIAQQVKEVLGDKDFGGYVYDTETDTMSLRYDQFISPLVKAIQELNTKLDAANVEIEALKAK
jgi:hypothetical protein